MKVLLGPLAKSGLETRVGSNLPAAVNAALVYYVGKLNSGRPPARIPDFLKVQGDHGDGEGPRTAGMDAAEPRPQVEVATRPFRPSSDLLHPHDLPAP